MQVDPGATIDALSSAIAELLAPPPATAFTPKVAILPAQTNLVGIGGFIGHSKTPPAERVARRLEGEIVVRVFADTAADLLDAEAQVSRRLLAASPTLLRQRGILRLQRLLDAPGRRLEAADGIAAPFGQELRFAVKFEHAPLPAQSEGAITEIPQDLAMGGPTRSGGLRYETEFLENPLADFTAVAGGTSGSASWDYHAPAGDESGQVRQTGGRQGGDDGVSGNKTGAYLILQDSVAGGALADFVLHADVQSDGPGGIGLVFRYRDTGNFSFFLMEEPEEAPGAPPGAPPGRRLFGRRRNGTGALLAEGGQDLTKGFPKNSWLRLRLLAEGDRFELAINETVALTGRDGGISEPGSVGFFCRGNPNARFRHIRLTGL
jgi:hypothetical protein